MNTLEQKKTILQKISQFFVMLLQRYLVSVTTNTPSTTAISR